MAVVVAIETTVGLPGRMFQAIVRPWTMSRKKMAAPEWQPQLLFEGVVSCGAGKVRI